MNRFCSNGTYSVFAGADGAGYSRWRDYLLTNWTPDRTEESGGLRVYCSEGGTIVSAAVCVAPEDDIEIRRLTLRNTSDRARKIEVTSYAEVVLNQAAAHAAHPAFSKLFVQTELEPGVGALLARRRPRSAAEKHPYLLHAMSGGGRLQHETDRARFLGRGRTPRWPLAMSSGLALSGTTGSVLDPVFSLRRAFDLGPGEDTDVVLLLACAMERAAVLAAAQRHTGAKEIARAFEAAAARQLEHLRACGLDADQGAALQELAAAMLYADPALRAPADVLQRAAGSPLGGAAPLAVVDVAQADELQGIDDIARARRYWRGLGLETKLAVLCPAALESAVRARVQGEGDVFADLAATEGDLIRAQAALYIDVRSGAHSTAALCIDVRAASRSPAPLCNDVRTGSTADLWSAPLRGARQREALPIGDGGDPAPLAHGFSDSGDEYVIHVDATRAELPPMPWINTIANEGFGFLVSETGAGYTWSRNSRENRLTPWYNDPIRDPHGEALYLRDETGAWWTPLPGPSPAPVEYEVRHGFGYSRWTHTSHDLAHDVTLFVPRHDAVKVARVRMTNVGAQQKQLSLYSYSRLVLGILPEESGRFVVTERDRASGALLARNRLNNEFAAAVVFAAAAGQPAATCTADRTAFLGRGGSPEAPAAVIAGGALDERTGAGLDPCAAFAVDLAIAPGETAEITFLLGEADDADSARALVQRYSTVAAVESALQEVCAFWRTSLGAVRVQTPSPAIDRMVCGWLLYQVMSCRVWARSAFYQSGGAFGFRDQLQDAAALVLTHPDMTRAQILLHAAHQFVEGDVLHWWHPPTSRGIRTRFADDLNWLPWITAGYIHTSGDWSVLDEAVRFLTAPALQPGEDEAYLFPTESGEIADVYEHCCRALDRSLTKGAHGLPLFGSGDWNDGMNRVGREGRGESVWMAFFLHRVIEDFAPLCERRGDAARLARYRAYQRDLETALEESAWDGDWYRRAYYDDGTPLGSAVNTECRIDALAQAWSVISAAAPRARAERAMDAVEEMLVDREAGLIRLLAPPFDRDPHDPGYIKGYVPGIRENGGQYTHGAVWFVQATAELGRRDRAAEYLEMLTPVRHASTPERVAVYQVEPYVVAADVYGVAPHVGRGGWTWYTGSAAWMFRVALGSVLGLRVEGGDTLIVAPCIPDDWAGFSAQLRLFGGAFACDVEVRNPERCSARVVAVEVDGVPAAVVDGGARVTISRGGATHNVVVTLGQ